MARREVRTAGRTVGRTAFGPGFVASVILLGAVLLCGVLLVVTGFGASPLPRATGAASHPLPTPTGTPPAVPTPDASPPPTPPTQTAPPSATAASPGDGATDSETVGDAVALDGERLPHREKYLRLVGGFMRRLFELHLDLVDDVERVLGDQPAAPGSTRPDS